MLAPGEFAACKGFRWDTGLPVVASGPATISNATAPTGTCVGSFSTPLNGTQYHFAAYDIGTECAIYSGNLTTGVWTEITSAGGATSTSWGGENSNSAKYGRTRFTVSDSADVTFAVISVERRYWGGAASGTVECLVIGNGSDYCLLYNPTLNAANYPQVVVVKTIDLPTGYEQVSTLGLPGSYMQVASATATKSFTNSTAARYKFQESSSAPYNANSDITFELVQTTSAADGDTAVVNFGAAYSVPGPQLNWVVQGTSTAVNDMFLNNKIEGSANGTDYSTIYDKSSADPTIAAKPPITTLDAGNNRYMVTLNQKNVTSGNQNYRYFRFTRDHATGATVPAYTVIVLAIWSPGSTGYAPGGGVTELSAVYADRFSHAESPPIVSNGITMQRLALCGGPNLYSNGSGTTEDVRLPQGDSTIFYDFRLYCQNADNGTPIHGGLSGIPSHVDVYMRIIGEDSQAYYIGSHTLYNPATSGGDKQWQRASANSQIYIDLGTIGRDYRLRYKDIPAPQDDNIALPRAAVLASGQNRLFAGNVKDENGTAQKGDLYISAVGFPIRFASTQPSETGPTRCRFDGETIKKVVMTAAAANGAANFYVFTDQTLNALGTAGGFVGSGYGSSDLSLRVRINDHGTNEPGSVSEHSGTIFYVDNESQAREFTAGASRNLSRNACDVFKNIPSSRRGKVQSAFWRDRWELFFTPSGETTNITRLAWNTVLNVWEYSEVCTAAQSVMRAYDSSQNGSGQRLVLFSGTSVYGLDESTSSATTIQLTPGELVADDENLFSFGNSQIMADSDEGKTLNFDYYYKPTGAYFRGTMSLTDGIKPQRVLLDSQTRTEQSSLNVPENGWAGYVDMTGSMTPGKKLYRWEVSLRDTNKGAAER